MNIWWRRLWLLLGTYQLLRILFLVFNYGALQGVAPLDLGLAILAGTRFDLAMIVTVNGPLALIHFLGYAGLKPRRYRRLDQLVSLSFIFANLPLVILGVVDARLFGFTGRRTSPDFFSIAGDIAEQSSKILLQYWWLTLSGVALCAAFSVLSWQRSHRDTDGRSKTPIGTRLAFGFALAAVCALAARGGMQRKPLAPAHAYVWQPAGLANLVLNSSITLLRSPPSNAPTRYHDFSSTEEIRKILTPKSALAPDHVPLAPGKNVVVLIVESLATEYVGHFNNGQGYTPFLDSLMDRSVTFSESFANARRSIDAMPTIFAAVPAWRDQPYVTSPYSGNEIQALPRLLKVQGYETLFFHGGANGSMHFDVFSAIAGFDRYFGKSEYPNAADNDGTWGVCDEPFLAFAADELDKVKKPFMAGIFTLSSHNPFSVPTKYRDKFPKGTLPIHESIGYADFSLAKFFKKAERLPWYANTLFVITGDHTSLSDRPEYNNVLGRFRVPIVIFDPSGGLPLVGKSKVAQHVDITPTILDLLGLEPAYPSLVGWSLFNPAYQGRFIQYEYGNWFYYDRETLFRIDNEIQVEAFRLDDLAFHHPLPANQIPPHKLLILKAARQYYINGLIENSWHK